MRPESYSRWVDPAPLEVERPRLPWWTMLPRKLLLVAFPVILVVVLVAVLVFAARRVWRYPLFLIGGVVLIGLGVAYASWWPPVVLLAVLGTVGALWARGRAPGGAARCGRPPRPTCSDRTARQTRPREVRSNCGQGRYLRGLCTALT